VLVQDLELEYRKCSCTYRSGGCHRERAIWCLRIIENERIRDRGTLVSFPFGGFQTYRMFLSLFLIDFAHMRLYSPDRWPHPADFTSAGGIPIDPLHLFTLYVAKELEPELL
jgi:hypothetical protein